MMESHPSPNSSTAPTNFSPASLLWAHQLRREHNTLVSRLDALDEALASYSAEVVSSRDELRAELDKRVKKVESVVGGVRGEFEGFKGGIDGVKEEIRALKEWRGGIEEWKSEDREKREKDEGERKRDKEERETKSGEIERQFKEVLEGFRALKELVEDMRREREEQMERETEIGREREHTLPVTILRSNPDLSDNDDFRSSSLPPIPQLHFQSQQVQQRRIPSTISGTTTVTHLPSSTISHNSLPSKVPRDHSAILVPDSIAPASPSSRPDHKGEIVTAVPTSPPENPFSPIAQPAAGLGCEYPGDQNLRQGPSESLESYFSRGEVVLSGFPRREENRIVLALWEGVRDEKVKKGLEVELEREGWRWEVVRGFVDGLGGKRRENMERDECDARGEKNQSGCGNVIGVGNGAVEKRKKKMKKRRVIPVIWPVDEEGEGWLVVQNRLS
ncbi:hypothetical protein AJ78_04867 [Emergomyces pasteurianus Ep9510]|uniref:Uncharacterized protein n=1 Tax=Emergomyces pasteurianus Ep9510 TaxID=1447872 RepID=A0A1J9Q3N0_9EURO|nr:hypothetical protein AJ78_04867 [Emergomyces pasteurianus Ep9510]